MRSLEAFHAVPRLTRQRARDVNRMQLCGAHALRTHTVELTV